MNTSLFRVRQYECDAYGHLNNVNYVRYLQEAIVEANASAGYTLARPSAAIWRWQTRRLDIEYLRPVRYGDTVELQISAPGGAAGLVRRVGEFRLAGSGDLVAQAVVEAVPVDAASGQTLELAPTVSEEPPGPAAVLPVLPPPPPGVFSMRHRVTWGDLDMARQVGDATLLSYVETCGFGVIAAHHWPAARMAAEGFAIILRRHQIENLASAALDDELEIATWVSNVQRGSRPRATTPSGGWLMGPLLTRVDTLGVWVDLTSGRPIRIPPDFLADFAPNLVG